MAHADQADAPGKATQRAQRLKSFIPRHVNVMNLTCQLIDMRARIPAFGRRARPGRPPAVCGPTGPRCAVVPGRLECGKAGVVLCLTGGAVLRMLAVTTSVPMEWLGRARSCLSVRTTTGLHDGLSLMVGSRCSALKVAGPAGGEFGPQAPFCRLFTCLLQQVGT